MSSVITFRISLSPWTMRRSPRTLHNLVRTWLMITASAPFLTCGVRSTADPQYGNSYNQVSDCWSLCMVCQVTRTADPLVGSDCRMMLRMHDAVMISLTCHFAGLQF